MSDPGSPVGEPEQADADRATADGGGGPARGLRAALGEEFSFAEAIGGVRGMVESSAPGLLFVVVYVAARALTPSGTPALTLPLVAASAVAVVAVLVRLVQRTPVTQAFSGLIGVGVGVAWAAWSGRAQDYFAGGLIWNVVYLLAMVASLAARWPVVGVVVALLRGEDMSWRTDPARGHERRRFGWATWVMAAVFALRLAVQVPLYLAGQTVALGIAKLAMGLPLFAVALWLTWLLVASPGARADLPDRSRVPPR